MISNHRVLANKCAVCRHLCGHCAPALTIGNDGETQAPDLRHDRPEPVTPTPMLDDANQLGASALRANAAAAAERESHSALASSHRHPRRSCAARTSATPGPNATRLAGAAMGAAKGLYAHGRDNPLNRCFSISRAQAQARTSMRDQRRAARPSLARLDHPKNRLWARGRENLAPRRPHLSTASDLPRIFFEPGSIFFVPGKSPMEHP